jgi:hypothetical protein
MLFLKALKDFIFNTLAKGVKIEVFPNLKSLVNVNQVHIDNSIGNKLTVDKNSGSVILNPSKFNPQEISEFSKLLPQAIDDDFVFAESDIERFLLDFKEKEKSPGFIKAISFLCPFIPEEDINIWRASIYLRNCFDEPDHDKEYIKHLKRQIIDKYGDKGRNIANLCSAGYLESFLIPLYDSLKSDSENEESAKNKFKIKYQSIVRDLPFTVFVSSKISQKELDEEIQRKMQSGTSFIDLHGIGKTNVQAVRKAIEHIEGKVAIKKSIKEENTIIFAKIIFPIKIDK